MLSSSAFWRTIAGVLNLFFSYTMRIWLVGCELNFFYGNILLFSDASVVRFFSSSAHQL